MNLCITPGPLEGTVTPPPSKSQAHRAILAQLLPGGGTVSNLAASQDIEATRLWAARGSGRRIPCTSAESGTGSGTLPRCLIWTAGSRAPPSAF